MKHIIFGLLATFIGAGNCDCDLGYLLGSNSECIPYVTEYNAACIEDIQCEWLGSNSQCNGNCNCKQGYHWYLGACQKYIGLGGGCVEDIDCFDGYNLQSLTCVENKCSCSEGFYQRGKTDCRKKAIEIDAICALNTDCQVPDTKTECVLGKCKKPSTSRFFIEEDEEEFFPKEEVSTLASPTQCTTSKDCTLDNTECYEKTGTCICKKQYFFNEDGTECIPELGVDVQCKSDSDCQLKPGKCENGVCFCRDYYFVGDGKRSCIKTISETNWNCISPEWCYALGKYTFCNSTGVCSCSKLAEYDEVNEVCVLSGGNDNSICSENSDCNFIDGGACINEVCGCPEGYLLRNNETCLPNAIGAQCNQKDCQIEKSVCVDDICQCEENYLAIDNTCYLAAPDLGNSCSVDGQCLVSYSQCLNDTCACNDNYIPYKNSCHQSKEFSSYCDSLFECTLSLGNSVQCRNRMCQCPTGYTMKEDKCSSGSVTKGSILFIALILKGGLLVFG